MRYRIKEVDGYFFPQSRSFCGWNNMRRTESLPYIGEWEQDVIYETHGDARQFLDSIQPKRPQPKVKPVIRIHPYP